MIIIYLFCPNLFFSPPQLRHSHPYFNSPLSSFGPWEVLDIMHANTTGMVGMSAHVFFIRREEEGSGRGSRGEQTRAMRHIAAQKNQKKTSVTCVEMSKVCFPCSVHFDAVTCAVGGFWLSLSSLSTGGSSSRSAHTSQWKSIQSPEPLSHFAFWPELGSRTATDCNGGETTKARSFTFRSTDSLLTVLLTEYVRCALKSCWLWKFQIFLLISNHAHFESTNHSRS